MAVDGPGRVFEEVLADAFEYQGGAEDGVPGTRRECACRDLGGAAIRHAGVHRSTGRDPGDLGFCGVDPAELGTWEDYLGKQLSWDARPSKASTGQPSAIRS